MYERQGEDSLKLEDAKAWEVTSEFDFPMDIFYNSLYLYSLQASTLGAPLKLGKEKPNKEEISEAVDQLVLANIKKWGWVRL